MNLPLHPLALAIRGSGGGKSGGSSKPPVEAPDSLRSIAYARILDLVSEGEIYGFADQANPMRCVAFNGTRVENDDGSTNFQNFVIDSRVGSQTQDPMEGFSGVESEAGVGVRLEFGTPWTQTFTNINVTALRLRLSVPSLSVTDTTNGNTNGTIVNYKIELSVDGGPFTTKLDAAFNGKTTSKYERSHRLELPPATVSWTLRVSRSTPESASQTLQNQTFIESVTEIIDAKLRMPMSAYVGVIVDAEQFNNIPTRAYRLRGRLIKVPSNYDPVTRAYTGIWDGTFATVYSNNPAWVFYDMATNSRYGLGHLVPAELIDKWALYKIAQYCDELVDDGFGGQEPRFTANLYLQTQQDALKVMQDMASMFRGIMYAAGGAITAVGDMPEDPIYTYTPANVRDGKFNYSGSGRKVRHTVALVSWNDMSDFGRAKVEYVADEEGIARYGIQPTEVIAIGCTSRGQARRMGIYILTTERFETDMLAFGVGLDGVIPAPGKIVNVADPLRAGRRTGGRLRAATLNSITVDELPLIEIGHDITVALPNGGLNKRPVTGIVGNTISVAPDFDSVPVPQSVWLVEAPNLKAQQYRILGVAEATDNALGHDIMAVQHVAGKFAFVEQGLLIQEPPISDNISNVIPAPTNVLMTHRDVADDNTTQKIVTLTWSPVLIAQSYTVRYRLNSNSWVEVGETASPSIDINSLPPGVFEVQVTAIGANGVRSLPANAGPFDIGPNIKPPGFLLQINADIAAALETAENAQAAADGAIVSFWQPNPPVIGAAEGDAKLGDIWFDTDDGNRIYRVVAGAWQDAQDDAIAQAILDAADAQATADGKVKLFVGPSAPVSGMQLNDLWFDTIKKATYRYNGADWLTPVADVTLDQLGGNGVNILPDQYSTFEQADLPPVTTVNGTVGRDSVNKKFLASILLSATAGDHHVYLGTTQNMPHRPGKYIVSFYYLVGAAVLGNDIYLQDTNGVHFGAGFDATVIGAWTRTSVVIDTSASTASMMRLRIANNGGAGVGIRYDGIMVEEALGNLNRPSAYTRGRADGMALSAILAAADAQATADGAIDIYRDSTPPVSAKFGDYWQDTDDGKWYANTSNTASPIWTESTDNRIPQAITDAAAANTLANTAQSTANSKIRLFYQEAQPTATTAGDQWYQPSTKLTRYWNGTAWSLLSDQTEAIAPPAVLNPSFEQALQYWGYNGGDGMYVIPAGFALHGANVLVKDSGAATTELVNEGRLPLNGASRVRVGARVRHDGGSVGNIRVLAYFYGATGNYITQTNAAFYDNSIPAGTWAQLTGMLTAPAGAIYCRFGLRVDSYASGVWLVDSCFMRLEVTSVDEVPNGTDYGKTANMDLYDDSLNLGLRRIGLNVKGSRKILGGSRNARASLVAGAASVRSTTSLTADSTGAVTVNAHNLELNGETVGYSAVSSAITGLTQGVSYVIYTIDPYLDGGTRTYFAQTSVLSAQQAGEGAVFVGNVTIPTSGSSGGGGGGGGDPDDWCVLADMLLPDGRRASDIKAGDTIQCWDYNSEEPRIIQVEVESNTIVDAQPSSFIYTRHGASVMASNSTPMTLRDGRMVKFPDMLGKEALVLRYGKLTWELVTDVGALGPQRVAKIKVSQHCYFAGTIAGVTVATHNPLYKP